LTVAICNVTAPHKVFNRDVITIRRMFC